MAMVRMRFVGDDALVAMRDAFTSRQKPHAHWEDSDDEEVDVVSATTRVGDFCEAVFAWKDGAPLVKLQASALAARGAEHVIDFISLHPALLLNQRGHQGTVGGAWSKCG